MADFSLPTDSVESCIFTLVNSVVSAEVGAARLNSTEISSPVWEASISSLKLRHSDLASGEWSAFIANLRGGLNNFLASDTRRDTLLAYPSAATPQEVSAGWDGTATVSAIDGNSITMADIPSGVTISKGDRVSLIESDAHGYFEFVESGVVIGTTPLQLAVQPNINTTLFTGSAAVNLWRPLCRFKPSANSFPSSDGLVHTSYSFFGRQKLL